MIITETNKSSKSKISNAPTKILPQSKPNTNFNDSNEIDQLIINEIPNQEGHENASLSHSLSVDSDDYVSAKSSFREINNNSEIISNHSSNVINPSEIKLNAGLDLKKEKKDESFKKSSNATHSDKASHVESSNSRSDNDSGMDTEISLLYKKIQALIKTKNYAQICEIESQITSQEILQRKAAHDKKISSLIAIENESKDNKCDYICPEQNMNENFVLANISPEGGYNIIPEKEFEQKYEKKAFKDYEFYIEKH